MKKDKKKTRDEKLKNNPFYTETTKRLFASLDTLNNTIIKQTKEIKKQIKQIEKDERN